ncbi:LOW QUALITY PROTEIN: peroxisomal membrane protein PEX16-like [Amphibalanus amphitrite]|uniref:LOW QUALITY PROTEIN: peroxisomal membrane protein PEX16-like n=1 Tax=Amphibalanus amphitrite TaxID=1232801 RepID=UPI001C91CD66|nr:LOW QUALITY PROTEIN: peroxisomal membrane protein PEX16-like [Amphibalanus amphitrite]
MRRTESRVSAVSELVYAVSRLLSLANRLLSSPSGQPRLPEVAGRRLRAWLALTEYVEVFLELAAGQLLGPTGRWAVIAAVQIAKALMRLALVYWHRCGMLTSPPIVAEQSATCGAASSSDPSADEVLVLPSTGRRVRSLTTVASPARRAWGVPRPPSPLGIVPRHLTARRRAAETLFICRPLLQLASAGARGADSWPAWLLPLVADIASQQLHEDPAQPLTHSERAELYSRRLQLLLYLLRSPFYERHTRDRLVAVLAALARHMPLGRYLAQPLLDYLPAWQRVYFYVW